MAKKKKNRKRRSKVAFFDIQCRGRDSQGRVALDQPVEAKVWAAQINEEVISLSVDCRHNTGPHGDRCRASHPNTHEIGEGMCPYAVDFPDAVDFKR